MDMTQFNKVMDDRLRKHTDAIREHQISVALMFLNLAGYEVELHYVGKPLAWEALETLEELDHEDQTAIWSCSTTAGGVWTTQQRRWLKTGTVSEAEGRNFGNGQIPGEA